MYEEKGEMSNKHDGGGRFKPNEGDWTCADSKCANVNFARRTECNKCGTSKSTVTKKDGSVVKKGGTEIGKQMAEKSKGLFSADDWQCKSCGNVNWARRMTCNVCNTPKYGKLEQRTGYGGGFMERDEIVEYKEKLNLEEDDYDQYGRLRKSKRGKITPVASIKEPSPARDDDEEEDDDDDGDVSKYKLESDDDDEDVDLSKYDLSDDSDSSKPNNKSSPITKKIRSQSVSSSSTSSSSSSYRTKSSSGSRRRSYSSRSRSVSPDNSDKRRRSSSNSRSRSRSPKHRRHSSGSKRSRH